MQRLVLATFLLGCAAPKKPATPVLDVAAIPPHATVMLGDLHGTREIPAFVGEFVSTLVEREPVVVALEITQDNTSSIDAYLASDGGPAARKALLSTDWWQSPTQDGRRSVAMLDMLDRLRVLRHAHEPLEVVLIDATGNDRESREAAMADNVLAARRKHAGKTLVVYAGNLHTSIGEVSFAPGFAWMAMRVAKANIPVLSLDARFDEGTSWVCAGGMDNCGVGFIPARGPERGIRIEPTKTGRGAYDGWFGVGPIHASPPAGRPDLAADFDAKVAAATLRGRAVRAYEARRYGECADLMSTIAAPDAATAYDHACCLARAGRKDEALAKLKLAIDSGFKDLAHAQQDEDLASLRDDPRWPIKND